MTNQIQIYHGDNLEILSRFEDESFPLIYLDPPYGCGKSFKSHKGSFDDKLTGQEFLDWLKPRIEEAKRLLTKTGSFFIHMDHHEIHYVKVMCDEIFGRKSFMNEIIWAYDYGGRSKSKWSSKHDTILWYAIDPKTYTYNYDAIDRIPYMAPGLVGPEKAKKGKSQPISEPVLTPNGYMPIGDIKVGDWVYGSNGKPTKVLGVYPQDRLPVYNLTFSDGSKTRSSLDHLWTFETQNGFRYTQPLYEWIKQDLRAKNGKWKWKVPLVAPVDFEESPLPIEPYTLGALLGDGSFTDRQLTFTSMDQDVVDNLVLHENCSLKERNSNSSGRATIYTIKGDGKINSMLRTLNQLGLQGKNSKTKFVPEIYKFASIEQRIALLQGLFDTDGSARKGQTIDLSTSSENLARDVAEVVNSLGGTAKINKRQTKCAPNFRLYVRLPFRFDGFRCKRKLETAKKMQSRLQLPVRNLISVEQAGIEENVCIRVESDDKLYVTNNYILTHNTPTDVWWNTIVPTNGKERTGYPTQKPLAIIERIVKVHSNPGDKVLDFFGGSGTTGEAAAKHGREATLVDSNIEAIEVMKRRLKSYGVIQMQIPD